MNIFDEYFVYKPTKPDEKHDYFHIVNLKKNSTVRIKDFTNGDTSCKSVWHYDCCLDKYIAFHDGIFYLANQNHIKVAKFDPEFAPGEELELTIDESQIFDIVNEGGCKIHGLFLEKESTPKMASHVLVALETGDFQIDLNMLVLTEDPGNANFNY